MMRRKNSTTKMKVKTCSEMTSIQGFFSFSLNMVSQPINAALTRMSTPTTASKRSEETSERAEG